MATVVQSNLWASRTRIALITFFVEVAEMSELCFYSLQRVY